ncbi:MAG: bifunctional (p)ppGpp synthetase/guanosine-3',5'-bis(diphosphate) 3'-pyrophosphohydrolase [Oxalobacter sp.]|nr:MAG: bifunctional (p)ppGpp synthetase/guanosine-3',5'-bis(diphosphate) 3'-pyrophosphohydrolase [Oxalobacter sp.]
MTAHHSELSDIRLLTKAFAFAAEKHRHQRRKDVHASPYINHPIQLVDVLTRVGKIEDVPTLIAAILHDTIEDTETSYEELRHQFGEEIARIVLEVTDNNALPKDVRKRLLVEKAPSMSRKAKLVKLADLIANVNDVLYNDSPAWPLERRQIYMAWAHDVVAGLRNTSAPLEAKFDALYAQRSKMVHAH